jgi:16S rRNA (adenine1518-N6/adenine1519-N6)-dimethyltransferase
MKRRSLGQHYLVDASVIGRLVSAADLHGTEKVVEIGTGKGVLTKELGSRCRRLEGFEVDRMNYEETLTVVTGKNVFIHQEDAFDARPTFDVIVSSLPYSRSQDFVEWISQLKYDRGVVVLQEDFVEKIRSPPGTRNYRAVSVIAQMSLEMNKLGSVSRSAFQPPPKVSSVILAIRPRMRLSEEEITKIKMVFSLRRRRVSSVLEQFGFATELDDFGTRRISSLTPEEVHQICKNDHLRFRRPWETVA